MKKIRFLILIMSCFFIKQLSVSAKTLSISFYANGGEVITKGFFVNEYTDFITRGDVYFANYNDKNKIIKNINSIDGKTFELKKSGTKLVSGREWYYEDPVNKKNYYFSNSNKNESKKMRGIYCRILTFFVKSDKFK